MAQARIEIEYFEWMYNIVCHNKYDREISYRKLLSCLHDIEFTHIIPKDANRAYDGVRLRHQFIQEYTGNDNAETYLSGECSVLELMVALAIRCERDIMDDTDVGDRTTQWFWSMIVSLGLGSMTDELYDQQLVEKSIEKFLKREYDPDGKGGLFTIRGSDRDLRKEEIWTQMCWYLDSIT